MGIPPPLHPKEERGVGLGPQRRKKREGRNGQPLARRRKEEEEERFFFFRRWCHFWCLWMWRGKEEKEEEEEEAKEAEGQVKANVTCYQVMDNLHVNSRLAP